MGRFYPLYIRRSDGVVEVTASNGKREKNEPTELQLDSTPDAKGVSDYYRLLSQSDAKYLDWMKKLGGMLIRELGGRENVGSGKSDGCGRGGLLTGIRQSIPAVRDARELQAVRAH